MPRFKTFIATCFSNSPSAPSGDYSGYYSFLFPYLYDFGLNAVLYYYPDPNNAGHYNTNGVRYFYNYATGQIISK